MEMRTKLQQIEERMMELAKMSSNDIEMNHIKADELLEEALIHLGQQEIVDAYRNVFKWYA